MDTRRQIPRATTSQRRAHPASRLSPIALLRLALVLLPSAACDPSSPTAPRAEPDVCGPFGAWQSSPYVLPYPVGTAYQVNQANCSGSGHSGFWSSGYDFLMPIGTTVTAARSGIVVHSLGGAEDGDRSHTNLVTLEHDDGTVALYSHLTRNGNLVEVGRFVAAGEPLGRSGDTGNTGRGPPPPLLGSPLLQPPGAARTWRGLLLDLGQLPQHRSESAGIGGRANLRRRWRLSRSTARRVFPARRRRDGARRLVRCLPVNDLRFGWHLFQRRSTTSPWSWSRDRRCAGR